MPRTDTSLQLSDVLAAIDAVFPYPYRGLLAVASKRYRNHVRNIYRDAKLRYVLLDGGLSALFAIGELVLAVGIPWFVIMG